MSPNSDSILSQELSIDRVTVEIPAGKLDPGEGGG